MNKIKSIFEFLAFHNFSNAKIRLDKICMTNEEPKDIIKQINRQVDRNHRIIEAVGNKFFIFDDYSYVSSVEKILFREFGVDEIAFGVKTIRNGKNFDLNALGIGYGEKNAIAVVFRIETHSKDLCLEEFVETLQLFPKFFPQHANKKLYGVIAADEISSRQERLAKTLGLSVAQIFEDDFSLKAKRRFNQKNCMLK